MLRVWVPADYCKTCADAFGRTVVPLLFVSGSAIQLYQCGVIDLRTKRTFDSDRIRFVTVRCDLDSACNTRRQIIDECRGPSRIPQTAHVRNNQLGFSINSSPCPSIPYSKHIPFLIWNVLFLRVAKTPNLIALDTLCLDVANRPVVVS